MSSAYDPLAWGNLFVAEVGASAALVGLLFVAVSINLAKIIALPGLPGRALEALTVLVMVRRLRSFQDGPHRCWGPRSSSSGRWDG